MKIKKTNKALFMVHNQFAAEYILATDIADAAAIYYAAFAEEGGYAKIEDAFLDNPIKRIDRLADRVWSEK